MKTEDKYKWMVWAIVILAVMNLATIATIIYNSHKAGEEINLPKSENIESDNSSIRYSGRYFRDQLNLNRDQMAMFTEFNPQFRQQVMDINIKLNRKRMQMLMEMSAPAADTERLDLLSDSVGFLHADLKKLTYKYYMHFKKICDEQQQKRLEQLFGEMFATDIQMGQYGRVGPNGRGRGRGRRFNY
jgi:hypothetical protein